LIAAQTAALIEALEREVGLELIVREADAGFIVVERILDGIELRTLVECESKRGYSVDVCELPIGLRLFSQLQFHVVKLRIAIGADGEAQIFFCLGERIAGLDHSNFARGNFRLGAIDIKRRQRA